VAVGGSAVAYVFIDLPDMPHMPGAAALDHDRA
jgi:hypothetical protein